MNKKVLVAVAVLALVAAACNSKTSTNTNVTTPPTPANSSTSVNTTTNTSLASLMAGGDQNCTYTDGQNTGTVFVSEGRARVDVMATVNGKATSVHSIVSGPTNYTWIDGQATGFKMSATATTSNSTSSSNSAGSQQVDPNKQLSYHCASWTVDNSKFALPTGINFMDMSDLNTGIMPPTGH